MNSHVRQLLDRYGWAAVAALLWFAAPLDPAWSKEYRNPDFHFGVALPEGLVACPNDGSIDHGPLIALETPRGPQCDDDSLPRFMGIFGYFNVLDEDRTFDGFANASCRDAGRMRQCSKANLGLKIGRLRTAVFRDAAPTGKIAIFAVAQNRTGPVLSCPTGINYSASLQTDPAHYALDLRAFRRFLASVRTSPPPRDEAACRSSKP